MVQRPTSVSSRACSGPGVGRVLCARASNATSADAATTADRNFTVSAYSVEHMTVGYAVAREPREREATAAAVLAGISVSHLLNDTIQSLVPAIYRMLKQSFALTFAQV